MTDDKSKLNEEMPANHHIDDEHMAQYREAAEQGDAEAQYQLGLGYVTSLDFEPNPAEALSDGAQQVSLEVFADIMRELRPLIAAVGRQ